jgi:arginine deiminase
MKFNYIVFGILFFSHTVFSQKLEYAHLLIDQSLKENANEVVRLNESTISITAQNAMVIQSKVITTVLNDFGLKTLNLAEYYDKNRKISKLDVTVYDGVGKEIKSFKKKDFRNRIIAFLANVYLTGTSWKFSIFNFKYCKSNSVGLHASN